MYHILMPQARAHARNVSIN